MKKRNQRRPGRTTRGYLARLRRLVVKETTLRRQLARNMAQQLIIYATGAPIGFSDRAEVENILASSRPSAYSIRTLIHEIVQTELFRKK